MEFLLAPRKRRGRLQDFRLFKLLDNFRITWERRSVFAEKVLFGERRTRTLAASLARLQRIADIQLVEREPIRGRIGDGADGGRDERSQARAEAEIERHQQTLTCGHTAIESRHRGIVRRFGHRLKELRIHELVDKFTTPALRRRDDIGVDELSQTISLYSIHDP